MFRQLEKSEREGNNTEVTTLFLTSTTGPVECKFPFNIFFL